MVSEYLSAMFVLSAVRRSFESLTPLSKPNTLSAGQFFPGTVGAWLFNSRYSGYYPPHRAGKPAVYVSAGTLWWGPPIRLTTRHHEITDIRLVRSQ